jgi:ATP-dependent DNA helicase DinG
MTAAAPAQLETFADASAILRRALPDYEERPQQAALAGAIEKILVADWNGEDPDDDDLAADIDLPPTLAGQAGCGTGKSFALAIPAALSGKKVVFATGTIALQRQVVDKDLPFLEEHLPDFPQYALLMGRGNYLCAAKLAEGPDIPQLTELQTAQADEDNEGTRDSIEVEITGEQWSKVSMTGTECPGAKQCPFASDCKAEKAKAHAADPKTRIIVTNYAMLGLDMILAEQADSAAGPMLGTYQILICDEADKIDSAMRNVLATKLTQRGLMYLASGAETFVKMFGDTDEDQLKEAVALTKAADALAAVLPRRTVKDKPDAEPEGEALELLWFADHSDQVTRLIAALKAVESVVYRVGEDNLDPKDKIRKRMLVNQARNAAHALENAIMAEDDEMARFNTWTTAKGVKHGERGETLFTVEFHPVVIADRLREGLWRKQRTILASATLTTAPGDFGFFTRTLGLEHAQTMDVGTPFDYQRQALMFIPDPSVPAPLQATRAAWLGYAIPKTLELVEMAGGGALLLYTSRAAMMEAHAILAPRLERMGLTVLVQDGNTPNGELARRFREDVDSVLFGLESFFVGLDVRGRALRVVVIDKLPFPVHTEPVHAARERAEIKAGRNPFQSLSIPIMTLKLTQGIGRLIRSTQDYGVVAILDSRLSSKGYGKQILDGLPNCPVEVEEHKVAEFLQAAAAMAA